MKNIVVAIDGPAGSGKSTVAKLVAEKLGFMYVDTGAMYRALTLKALQSNIDFNDAQRLIEMAKNTKIEFRMEGGKNLVFLDGIDVSQAIRTEDVSKATHHLASIFGIREILWCMQRQFREKFNIVMEGRDIGSKVFPDAQVKIFLDACLDERARRRFLQLKQMGIEEDIKKIQQEIYTRDKNDENRAISPLIKLPDAYVIDTTELTIQQVVDRIITIVQSSI